MKLSKQAQREVKKVLTARPLRRTLRQQARAGVMGELEAKRRQAEKEARDFMMYSRALKSGCRLSKAKLVKAVEQLGFNPWEIPPVLEMWFKGTTWHGAKDFRKRLVACGFNVNVFIVHLEALVRQLKK